MDVCFLLATFELGQCGAHHDACFLLQFGVCRRLHAEVPVRLCSTRTTMTRRLGRLKSNVLIVTLIFPLSKVQPIAGARSLPG